MAERTPSLISQRADTERFRTREGQRLYFAMVLLKDGTAQLTKRSSGGAQREPGFLEAHRGVAQLMHGGSLIPMQTLS